MSDLGDLIRRLGAGVSQPDVAAGQPTVRNLPAGYSTQLPLMDEFQFRNWAASNNVPFNPDQPVSDYDMRGFYQASQQQQPGVTTAVNPNDGLLHFTDRFKTPQHASFSNESQWAGPNAPRWINDSQLASPGGRILFDERKR